MGDDIERRTHAVEGVEVDAGGTAVDVTDPPELASL